MLSQSVWKLTYSTLYALNISRVSTKFDLFFVRSVIFSIKFRYVSKTRKNINETEEKFHSTSWLNRIQLKIMGILENTMLNEYSCEYFPILFLCLALWKYIFSIARLCFRTIQRSKYFAVCQSVLASLNWSTCGRSWSWKLDGMSSVDFYYLYIFDFQAVVRCDDGLFSELVQPHSMWLDGSPVRSFLRILGLSCRGCTLCLYDFSLSLGFVLSGKGPNFSSFLCSNWSVSLGIQNTNDNKGVTLII